MTDDTLTPEEVAAELGLSRFTVMDHLRRGLIPGFRLGPRWYIDAATWAEHKRALAAAPADKNRIEPRTPRSAAAHSQTRTHR